jgi:twitching motility protein PilT
MKGKILEDFWFSEQLLQVMIDNEWTDMFITVGTFPCIKIAWEIVRIDEWVKTLSPLDTMRFAESLISHKQRDELLQKRNLDFAFTFSNRRFRCNISFQMWTYMVVLRLLSADIPSIDVLWLPDIYKEVTRVGQGLILVTGPTGSGKSTTLASMIDYINTDYNKHIITIEDPVEYLHTHKKSVMEQKEIWKDVLDYETALIWAMRQNPNVILFWEMRSTTEIEMALTLAETGHLVLSTLHTRSAYQTISRVIDTFESWQQNQIRLQLADSLVAVFSQRLLKTMDWTWLKLAKEIMFNNSAVSNLIRENDLHQIPSVIQMWAREWMQLIEKDITDLIQRWSITEEEWLKFANNPKIVKEALSN